MTTVAASILGYIFGLCTALLVGAISRLVRGGRELRDSERRLRNYDRPRSGDRR